MPATISAVLFERDAGRGRAQAGEGVEQRDDDRHVGAADRQHDDSCRASAGGTSSDDHEQLVVSSRRAIATPQADGDASSSEVEELLRAGRS